MNQNIFLSESLVAWLFLAPAGLLLGVFVLWPIAYCCVSREMMDY